MSLISPARVRPHVYTRARIMRARGRAHAPARGDKPLVCSRIRYGVEACSRIPVSPVVGPGFAGPERVWPGPLCTGPKAWAESVYCSMYMARPGQGCSGPISRDRACIAYIGQIQGIPGPGPEIGLYPIPGFEAEIPCRVHAFGQIQASK